MNASKSAASDAATPPWTGPGVGQFVPETLNADTAYGLAGQGTALLWRGDYHQARQLLTALGRRCDRLLRTLPPWDPAAPATERAARLHRVRQIRSQRTRMLNLLRVPLTADYVVPLRRAPDVRAACEHAWGPNHPGAWVPLRELLGIQGAYEWHRRGVPIPALNGACIHPDYSVFAPTRTDYLAAVAQAPLPVACATSSTAMDVGTGTGVLAAILAQRGLQHVWASDIHPRAVQCAQANIARLKLQDRVTVVQADLFPTERAALIVCNPPWLPGRAFSPLDLGVFDEGERMLQGFLGGLAAHLLPGGEGWLIMSDLAEHLGLRAAEAWDERLAQAGLRVLGRHDTPAQHPRSADPTDSLHGARAAEVVTLWRLGA